MASAVRATKLRFGQLFDTLFNGPSLGDRQTDSRTCGPMLAENNQDVADEHRRVNRRTRRHSCPRAVASRRLKSAGRLPWQVNEEFAMRTTLAGQRPAITQPRATPWVIKIN